MRNIRKFVFSKLLVCSLIMITSNVAIADDSGLEEDPDVESGSTTTPLPQVTPKPDHEYAPGSAEIAQERIWLDKQSSLFGLGFTLGNPAGISGKIWILSGHGVQFHVGAGPSGNHLRLSLDYLYHWRPVDITDDVYKLPFYVGIGMSGGIIVDDPTLRGPDDSGSTAINRDRVDMGVRFPVGMCVLIGDLPVEIAIEVAPDITFYEDLIFFVDGGMSVRYYF